MVYYRKYRPQTISELDLNSVKERLTSILQAKELPHAFLFTGPKGLGKTSSARILAKAINCENKKGIEPCNECDNCKSITSGSNIDVIEIDAASNRGIDEIRDLREKIKYSPASLPKKVYIIDEVHMLTTDAFNALLKTLEEPPAHAVFILCTTEVEKVPATIASRTFHVQFQKPSPQEIIRSLERIVKGEKLDIEPVVLDEIFKLSEGSFRDAAKILEELAISSPDAKITLEVLNKTYKTANLETEIQNLLTFLSKKDLQGSMKIIDELAQKGTDFKVLTERVAQTLHKMIMVRVIPDRVTLDITLFSNKDIKELLSRVNDSFKDIKFSVLPQIPLELVVVGWCIQKAEDGKQKTDSRSQKTEEKIVAASEVESDLTKAKQSSPNLIASSPPAPRNDNNQKTEVRKQNAEDPSSVIQNPSSVVSSPSSEPHGILFDKNSKTDNFLAAFLSAIKQDNHSIAGILRGCKLIELKDTEVILETRFKFHKDKLSEPKASMILDTRASELLAEKVHVVVNLIEK